MLGGGECDGGRSRDDKMVTLMLEEYRTMGRNTYLPPGCRYGFKFCHLTGNMADAWKVLAGMAFCMRAVELATRN